MCRWNLIEINSELLRVMDKIAVPVGFLLHVAR